MSRRDRLLVIAIQEATLDLIEPWAEDGTLPTLKQMMDGGIRGRIRGMEPLSTPHNWANILTGMGAGRHGVFDFWQRDGTGRFYPTSRRSLREKPVWSILEEQGLKSAIVNVPLTFPPQAAGGFMIAGPDTPGVTRAIADPPEIYDQITKRFGSYRPNAVFPGGRQKSDYLGLFERETAHQTDVCEHLLSTNQWDFGLVYFADAAMAQHYFWADMDSGDADNPYRNLLRTAYRCLDESVARLIAVAGPEATVFVVSECGAGPLRYGVQINTWLHQEGFLRWNGQGPSGSLRPLQRMGSAVRALGKRGRLLAKRHVPQSVRFWLNQQLPALKGAQGDGVNHSIDWARTRAFAQGKEGSLFINLKGRDPYGIVAPGAEYETVRQAIIDRLGELRDPDTSEPAVTHVYRREELFDGPWTDLAPDLFIEWRDDMYMPTEQEGESDKVFVTRWREGMSWPTTGSHRVDGVLIATGPQIRPGTEVSDTTIFDLLPTWLSILGQPVPDGLKGQVIEPICCFAPSGVSS
ncbi:MAG: alkaline phosphatase family protein [Gemmatimonadales bacterium]